MQTMPGASYPTPYIIAAGERGRDRLRLLRDMFRPTTQALMREAGVAPGMTCLDLGCGIGDASRDLAALTGPTGRVTGIDRDDTVIAAARQETPASTYPTVDFRQEDVTRYVATDPVDVVYARFLLSHLPAPEALLDALGQVIVPGGRIILEDVDFHGSFCYPERPAFARFVELYIRTAQSRGADATIGSRLPVLLHRLGWTSIGMRVIQPAGLDPATKHMVALTMSTIADAVIAEGLSNRAEIRDLVADLEAAAADPGQLLSNPRVIQVWAIRPS